MPKQTIHLAWDAEYEIKNPPESRELVILLHGFQQSGSVVFKLLKECAPSGAAVLAPNAPFPFPRGTGRAYLPGYTWYFYDPETDAYLYDMSLALHYASELIRELGLASLPKKIVGYSQGGYLAPFLGTRLSEVRSVIGVNCRFRSEVLTEVLPFRIDAIHGEKDVLVDPVRARACHQTLIDRGCRGEFYLIPDRGHGIDGEIRKKLKDLLLDR